MSEKTHPGKCRGTVKISLVPTLSPQATSLCMGEGGRRIQEKIWIIYEANFFFLRFFVVDSLLYWICCNIASGIFGVLASRHVGP